MKHHSLSSKRLRLRSEKQGIPYLIEIYCEKCHKVFYICPSCFRGHKYCSKKCSEEERIKCKRRAQHKYQSSFHGKRKNAARQELYRQRKKNSPPQSPPPQPIVLQKGPQTENKEKASISMPSTASSPITHEVPESSQITDPQKKVTHHSSPIGGDSCKTPTVKNQKEEPAPSTLNSKSTLCRTMSCDVCGKTCKGVIPFDIFLKRRMMKRRRLDDDIP